jgi:hypothetical protein
MDESTPVLLGRWRSKGLFHSQCCNSWHVTWLLTGLESSLRGGGGVHLPI